MSADQLNRVVTLPMPDVPQPVAHGLVFGAHRQVMNGQPWNVLGPAGANAEGEVAVLAEDWGVTTAADWRDMMEGLAETAQVGQSEVVLALRREMAGRLGLVEPAAWASGLHAWADEVGLDESDRGELVAEAHRIAAYEGFLRDAGLLPPDRQIRSLHAWNFARGVNMARDGLAAGLCDLPTASTEIIRFDQLSRAWYSSWAEFGVAFTLGRLLWSYDRYDELTDWGSAVSVDRTLTLQRVLLDDPASPWLLFPFDVQHPV